MTVSRRNKRRINFAFLYFFVNARMKQRVLASKNVHHWTAAHTSFGTAAWALRLVRGDECQFSSGASHLRTIKTNLPGNRSQRIWNKCSYLLPRAVVSVTILVCNVHLSSHTRGSWRRWSIFSSAATDAMDGQVCKKLNSMFAHFQVSYLANCWSNETDAWQM